MSRLSTRVRAFLWLVGFTLSLPLLLWLFSNWLAGQEAAAATSQWGDPHVGVVADTTSSMGPELALLADAYSCTGLDAAWCPPWSTDATQYLVPFRDQVGNVVSTKSAAEFANLLDDLSVGGGGECPDAALPALLTMAANLPAGKTPASDVLLVTDASPAGQRQQLMLTINKLIRRGVRVHPLVSGECPQPALPIEAFNLLALATGGQAAAPAQPGDYQTDTAIIMNRLGLEDLLLVEAGFIDDNDPDLEIPLGLGGPATTLGVHDCDDCYRRCLTCIVPSEVNMAQLQLVRPNGNPVPEGAPGYAHLESGTQSFIKFQPAAPVSGQWKVRVSGSGNYFVQVKANTNLHLALLSPPILPLNREAPLRAALIDETGTLLPPLTSTFELVSYFGQGTQALTLFDDGAHGDGAAGDGVYGGLVTADQPGLWRLKVSGQLKNGAYFQRLEPVPIRVPNVRLADLDERQALLGSERELTFEVENTTLTQTAGTVGPAASLNEAVFDLGVESSLGWAISDTVPASLTLAPGETAQITVTVRIPAEAAAGLVEETSLAVVPRNDFLGGTVSVARTEAAVPLYLPAILKP